MSNDLVTPDDLVEFPGAPFADALVDSAASSVRDEAGWHIAPQRTEVVEVDSTGGPWLFLPSLNVTAVTLVEDITSDAPVTLDGWKRKQNGRLYRAAGWPAGVSAVRVTMTHGYLSTPADLLPVIAARCQESAENSAHEQKTVGPFSVRLRARAADGEHVDPALVRYRLVGIA